LPGDQPEDGVGDESTLGQFLVRTDVPSGTVDERDEANLTTLYGRAETTFIRTP
jgi:hypothetical protein